MPGRRPTGAWFLLAGAVAILFLARGAAPAASVAPPGASMLLVVDKAESRLALIDPAAVQVIAGIPTGEMPHEVAASADGHSAFVTNYGTPARPGHSLSIIGLTARQEIQRVDLGMLTRPHGIVLSGGRVYFTAEGAQAVARLDPATNRVDWSVKTGQMLTHMLVVTPDRKKLYATNIGSDSVSAVEIGTGRVTQIAVGKEPEGLDLSPDGRELWVGQNSDGRVSIIDTGSDQVKQTIAMGQVPIRVKFTPDGTRVLISDMAAGELVVVDAASRQAIQKIPVGAAPVGVLVAPDGKRAYVAATAANQVVVIDLEKLTVAGRIAAGAEPDGMAWVAGVH